MANIQPIHVKLKNGFSVLIRSALDDDAAALLNSMKTIFENGEGVVLLPEEFKRTEERQKQWIRELREGAKSLLLVAEVSGRTQT